MWKSHCLTSRICVEIGQFWVQWTKSAGSVLSCKPINSGLFWTVLNLCSSSVTTQNASFQGPPKSEQFALIVLNELFGSRLGLFAQDELFGVETVVRCNPESKRSERSRLDRPGKFINHLSWKFLVLSVSYCIRLHRCGELNTLPEPPIKCGILYKFHNI